MQNNTAQQYFQILDELEAEEKAYRSLAETWGQSLKGNEYKKMAHLTRQQIDQMRERKQAQLNGVSTP